MTEIAVEAVAKTVWSVLKPFAVFIACAAVGFGAGEMFEHSGPRPSIFGWSPLGQSLKTQRDTARGETQAVRDQLAMMTASRDGWQKADQMCEAARKAENQAAADRVTTASEAKAAAADSSFDNGYAAGKAVGLRSCGAPHAPLAPVPAGSPVHPSDGVRDDDVAGLFAAGAYRPVQSQRPGPEPR